MNPGAAHLRGRINRPQIRRAWVQESGKGWYSAMWRDVRDHYWFEVVNTRTGQVVYRSDAFGFTQAIELCSQAVFVIREAWSMDLRRRALR